MMSPVLTFWLGAFVGFALTVGFQRWWARLRREAREDLGWSSYEDVSRWRVTAGNTRPFRDCNVVSPNERYGP